MQLMRGLHPVSVASLTCLSACVGQPAAVPTNDLPLAEVVVTVGTRDFVAGFVPGTTGTVLTAAGAVGIAGTGVLVQGVDLGRDEGIVAKEAARTACTGQGGRFQPAAIGRYAGPGQWVFDGACA